MKHLDLFSGIGGFALAVEYVWKNAEHIFCDNDEFCQKILKQHWPTAKIYGDIRTIDKSLGQVDLITGGFPCQPFSEAGERKGKEDDRYLWPEMLRVIQDCQPEWVVAENVYGLLTFRDGVVFEQVCLDLERENCQVFPFIIPACGTDAPHRRDRLWIIAHSQSKRRGKMDEDQQNGRADLHIQSDVRFWRQSSNVLLAVEPDWSNPSSGIRRNDDGLSQGVDRLKALGNAIVPQVAIHIMQAIKTHDEKI